ncbi:hypothetical protein P3T73_17040 [Kiritimatiellota bacterium B12222]|nr:hypothetical protein P3T73_17040 [Kiritimatiellota bacterium B12222]
MAADKEIQRDLGEQPMAKLMKEHGLSVHDLVAISPEPMTHKMVARACKGRRLTSNTRNKMIKAMGLALGKELKKSDLFTY